MPLRVLCAGCSKDERESAETTVKEALGAAAGTGAWSVSLVKLGDQWSVTLDAPPGQVRSRTLMTPATELRDALTGALSTSDAALAAGSQLAPGLPPASTETTPSDRLACTKCSRAFVVLYDAVPGEPLEAVPVACPHCWSLNQVQVGAEAAASNDYRAEKAAS
jgi:hypothetical protein